MSRAPDYIEPVVGWRIWSAVELSGELSLTSIYYRAIWPAGEPLRAECARLRLRVRFWRRSADGPHPAPAEGCDCGIYALAPEEFRPMMREIEVRRQRPVVGRVLLWGDVHEHERGWRASLAYPERLYVFGASGGRDDSGAERLSTGLGRYGVPVEVLSMSPSEVMGDAYDAPPLTWAV